MHDFIAEAFVIHCIKITVKLLSIMGRMKYCNDPMFLDRQVCANSVDPDLHCLPLHLHLLDALLYGKALWSKSRVITAKFLGFQFF